MESHATVVRSACASKNGLTHLDSLGYSKTRPDAVPPERTSTLTSELLKPMLIVGFVGLTNARVVQMDRASVF